MNKVIVVGFTLLLAGCVSKSEKPVVSDELEKIKQEMASYKQALEEKQAIAEKVEEISQFKKTTNKKVEKYRFDVMVESLSADLFFLNLMQGTEENIVVHPGVAGDISLRLSQVSLDEVMSVVRDVYGFDYKYQNSIYTVFPRKLRTEIFPINYINVKRVGVSDTSVLTGNVESTAQAGGQSESNNLSGEGATINPGSRIQTRSETDFWSSLNKALSQLIGVSDQVGGSANDAGDGQRRVVTNPQTGVAIITAMPNELAAVRKFLEKTRLSVKRQVIIEAKILEVRLSESQQTGVNWNAINGQLLLGKNASTFDSGVGISAVSEGVGEVFSSLIRISDIRTLLSLLETQGDLQVLSSPRVSTVNNQKAVIRVGSDQFFVTGVSSSTISNASSTTSSPDVELSSFFSGISLDVTPQISDDGAVILHIHPVISTVTEEQKNIVVGNANFTLPLALRDIRESDSIVKAESGQVIVLGGLMQERVENIHGRRPGLSDAPVVGGLFKSKQASSVKSELIILLKPTVVEQDTWVNDFNETQNRFEKLNVKPQASLEPQEQGK